VTALVGRRPPVTRDLSPPPVLAAGAAPVDEVLQEVRSSPRGLTTAEATRRISDLGPNGVALPFTPLAHRLGFVGLPIAFLATIAGLASIYLMLIEFAKTRFYAAPRLSGPVAGAQTARLVEGRSKSL